MIHELLWAAGHAYHENTLRPERHGKLLTREARPLFGLRLSLLALKIKA